MKVSEPVYDASQSIFARAAKLRLFGKSPATAYLRFNKPLWEFIPRGLQNSNPVHAYGTWLQSLVRLSATREQYFGTFFLRNRPALELMRRIADKKPKGATLRIAVLACSAGAEVYSILWTIRSARPDLKVSVRAVDISQKILNFAENGVYASDTTGLVGSSIFERLTAHEMEHMFDWKGDAASVKPWLREGITWQLGDASSPELIRALGPQDIVVANNFLCHMEPPAAESCLRNIAGLLDRGGCLFVSGVDLDVRAKVARELGWRPIPELLEQIHDGDPCVRNDWPWKWWGLEPLNRSKPNWRSRYAAFFEVNDGNG
ncbi:CheR family methyltransferase [Bradyrhizobium sp. Cp5.3]|uniref:CheR family methyltransferase n=1 Tax=Bradyrhizobium sp. Cp5.3 TaxID=443598 RepID=UPI000420A132|nr:CheR family methyltransferase [Bradyrhizobium sp. Cp5.3]